MTYKSYEISLWTHNDKFVTTLLSSETPKFGDGYDPRWIDNVNGETKLSFTMPIIYFSTIENKIINNEKWYNELKQNQTLANEKKIKLIFDKFSKDVNNKYSHKIYELVIESLVEERTDTELVCRVECVGAAFKELGKTGVELTLGFDNFELDENAVNIIPTIDYWLDQIFPPTLPNEHGVQWTYAIEMSRNLDLQDKIYEGNAIEDWRTVDDELVPIYSPAPIEKARFVEAKDSNRYNITQDIAETFQVFVKYRYSYENADDPFRVTKKEAVFYDRLIEPTEYSITYGNNETGLVKTSSSVDVVTKMFVDPIESEYSDDGFVSLNKAKNSKTKDNFILNFDYFIESGQMPSPQQKEIPVFEKALREKNESLEETAENSAQLRYDVALLEADISNFTNKRDAAEANIAEIDNKLVGYNTARPTYIIEETDVLNTARLNNNEISCAFRLQGVITTGVVVKLSNGTIINPDHYTITTDGYGYGKTIVFKPASGVVDRTLLRLTHSYDLLNFYRNERMTQVSLRDSAIHHLASKQSALVAKTQSLELAESALVTEREAKKELIARFNNYMSPFLKEGRWSDSSYKPSFERKSETVVPLVYDPIAFPGEHISSYQIGQTTKYFPYIIMPSTVDAAKIEELVVIESFTEGGLPVMRELRYGAQWTPQFIYRKLVSDTSYNTLANLITANPSADLAYYVKDTGLVYHNNAGSWVQLATVMALVFEKDVKIKQAGHTFKINGATIPAAQQVAGDLFTIARRRWLLTQNGKITGTPLRNFQTNTMQLRRSSFQLTEFDDYMITHDGNIRSITLKINNDVTYDTTQFNVDYKLDISSEQLYRDALDVSKLSAFPEVSYDVSFSYLNGTEVMTRTGDYNVNKQLELGSIVRITDYELQILGLRGLVSGIEMNLNQPEETNFTIQNYKTKFEDLFSRIVASTEQMKTSGYLYDRIAGAFGADLTLNASLLQRSIDESNLTFVSGMKNGVSFGEHGILAQTMSPYPTGVKGQTLITGEGILLSDSIDSNGKRIWTTAISPMGINADLIKVGRLDVSMVNIYSGNQRRFSWKADGMFAYRADSNGLTMYDTFVRYSDKGLLFQDNGVRAVELGWKGLYIGSQKGSVELTADGGLEIFNAHEPEKQLLVKLGGFGNKDAVTGIYEDYGMKFYKHIDGVQTETLVSTNSGELWLRENLMVGADSSLVGITGLGEYRPLAPLYDINVTYQPGTYVKDSQGNHYQAKAVTKNHALQDTNFWQSIPNYTLNDPVRIWAGNEVPEQGIFRLTHSGALYATAATISGTIIAESGSFGGWTIDTNRLYSGTGATYVELNTDQNNTHVLWAGALLAANASFSVTKTGGLKATKGTIGGFDITSSRLFGAGVDDSDYIGLGFDSIYRIWAGNPSAAIAPFSVDRAGAIKATKGRIGGFSLTDTLLYRGTTNSDYVAFGAQGDYRIWAGHTTANLAPFSVDKEGNLTAYRGWIGGFTIGLTQLNIGVDINDYVGLGVDGNYRIWAGAPTASSASFSVDNQGAIRASKGKIGGFSLTDKILYYGTGADNYIGFGEYDDTYRLWAGHSNPLLASFSLTKKGHMHATSGDIAGHFTVGGNLSSTYFASGALGNGWIIKGDGSAEFNNVYVRGTIAASVFEYQSISSVGGSLYIAPALITMQDSNPITSPATKYVFTVPENFSNTFRGGREWMFGDYVSLSGHVLVDGVSYELKDVRSMITGLSVNGITITSILDKEHVICYNEERLEIGYNIVSLIGGSLLKDATLVFLGTVSGGETYNKGILLSSISLEGDDVPFIDVYDDINSRYGNPVVRLGNLKGIIDPAFGQDPLSGYGLYAENAYLTGAIIANKGFIGGEDGWAITSGSMYYGNRPTLASNTTGMYLGKEGFGLGSALVYNKATNGLDIRVSSLKITVTTQPEPVDFEEYVDEMMGYRVEIISTSDILSSEIPATTLTARVWHGSRNVTPDIEPSRYVWSRVSGDTVGDTLWNNNPLNQGKNSITLITTDVLYSATYFCELKTDPT